MYLLLPPVWRWFTMMTGMLLLVVLFTGCSPREQVELTVFDVEAITDKAMQQLDSDGDNKLSSSELDKCPGLKNSHPYIDLDKDRSISRDELRGRLQGYVSEQIGVLNYPISVRYRGKPLAEAKVTLVPEDFFEGVIQTATGETDDRGIVTPTIELPQEILDRGTYGFRPGVYRVQVSKLDASGKETLPKKYNSDTTLGLEVKMDEHMEQKLRLTLK